MGTRSATHRTTHASNFRCQKTRHSKTNPLGLLCGRLGVSWLGMQRNTQRIAADGIYHTSQKGGRLPPQHHTNTQLALRGPLRSLHNIAQGGLLTVIHTGGIFPSLHGTRTQQWPPTPTHVLRNVAETTALSLEKRGTSHAQQPLGAKPCTHRQRHGVFG